MKNIPIIIPCYNQLTYLKNLIIWWRFYNPENPIYIVDNGSNYKPLLDFYKLLQLGDVNTVVYFCESNNFIPNLKSFIEKNINHHYEYYVISDADIMPHPSTPGNFLEVLRSMIENHKFHRAGFNLIINDLPEGLNNRASIIENESQFRQNPILHYQNFPGHKAPIDTTFCLYKTENGGWEAPMNGQDWGNCLRLFEAFHLPWYIDSEHVNPEMDNYFTTCKKHIPGQPSAGANNNSPKKYRND